MENKTLLIKCLGSSPVIQIIDFFLDNRLFDYSKNEIIDNLNIGRATFFKYWQEMEKFSIVQPTRKIGMWLRAKGSQTYVRATKSLCHKSTLYKLSEKNEIVKKLIALDSVLCEQAMDMAYKEQVREKLPVPVPA